MITLGIDPGTRRVGYGVVRSDLRNGFGGGLEFITAGILKIESVEDADALCDVKNGIDELIEKYKPDAVAIEKLFFAKNQKTAIAVAQARGVILLAAREKKVRVCEYTPNEVKIGVAGYGMADKKAVLKMVQLILGKHNLKIIDDASDGLALAIIANNPANYSANNPQRARG